MSKQSILISILVFILLIFSNAIVLANSITFPEGVTLEIPANIEVSVNPLQNGVMTYILRVYDKNIWRQAFHLVNFQKQSVILIIQRKLKLY